jgi:hypothetical protein
VMRPWSSVLMMAVSAALSTIWRHCEAEMGGVLKSGLSNSSGG